MCYFRHISLGKSFEVARSFWGRKERKRIPPSIAVLRTVYSLNTHSSKAGLGVDALTPHPWKHSLVPCCPNLGQSLARGQTVGFSSGDQ